MVTSAPLVAHSEASVGEELKCGAYEGHCCQRSAGDQYSVGGVALVFVEFDSLPDVLWCDDMEDAA